jgi:fumarate reductase subunit C
MKMKELLKYIEKDNYLLNKSIKKLKKQEKTDYIIKCGVCLVLVLFCVVMIFKFATMDSSKANFNEYLAVIAIIVSMGSLVIGTLTTFGVKSKENKVEESLKYLRQIAILQVYNSDKIDDKDKVDIIKAICE